MLSLLIIFIVFTTISGFDSPGIYQVVKPIDHAESPTWDVRKGLLYFVNIHEGGIYSYDPKTEELWSVKLPGEVAPVVPSKNNSDLFIVGLNRSVVAMEWDGRSHNLKGWKTLATLSEQFPVSRVNEGKADKDGRFWIGTMGHESKNGDVVPNHGILYRLTKDNISWADEMVFPTTISNGLAWNKANDKFFFIDTATAAISQFEYDNGRIRYSKILFSMKNHKQIIGGPDGMTIDEDDNLWVALYGGGAVIQVNSTTGALMRTIAIPALDVTSACWGGPNLDILYVTTSRYSLTEAQKRQQPAAGSVFAVVGLGTKGLPMYDADLINSLDDL